MGGLLVIFATTLTQTCHGGKKEATIFIYGYGLAGVAPNLFVCVVYVAPVGSKHDSEYLFQNLAVNIDEVQNLGGIILLGRDFNVCIAALLDTIDTDDLCELLHTPKLVETKQPNIVVKQ
jgi:hypothetical protein